MFTLRTNTGAWLPLKSSGLDAAVTKAELMARRLNTKIIIFRGSKPVAVSLP